MNTISVVIPLYNRADLIVETLISIENQSLKPYEVLVVDDHSTDTSVDVVKNFKKTSNLNIIILENESIKGQCGALNWGFKKSTGNFIAMQDSDDLWMPTHLKNLYEALHKYPESNIAFSAIEVFGPAKDTLQLNNSFNMSVKRCLDNTFKKNNTGIWKSNNNLLFNLLMFGEPFRCQASLIKKDFLDKNNLTFDTDITYSQDAQFMTIASYFTSFLYVDVVGVKLRRHAENDGNISYGDNIRKSYEIRVDKLKKFFIRHKVSIKEKKALYHRLWCLQIYVADQKAAAKVFNIRMKTALELLRKVPTWSSIKSAIKLLVYKRIV